MKDYRNDPGYPMLSEYWKAYIESAFEVVESVIAEKIRYRRALERIVALWDGTEMGDTEDYVIARTALTEAEEK